MGHSEVLRPGETREIDLQNDVYSENDLLYSCATKPGITLTIRLSTTAERPLNTCTKHAYTTACSRFDTNSKCY
jgi:hypothetical protein